MPDAIMLFAAGFGTRMGALTQDRPKPLIPVAGRPLLDHALNLARDIPVRVVNAHYHAGQIQSHLAKSPVRVALEYPDILDTGGGLRHAQPLLGNGPVYTLNTDAVWSGPNPLHVLRAAWRPDDMDALLLCVPLTRAIGREAPGDFTLGKDGILTRGGDMVYTGAQILRTDLLDQIPERAFSLNLFWNRIAKGGRLHGVAYDGQWCDVGHPDGITKAERLLKND